MYQRFLNNTDYIGIVTEEALEQLIRGNELRLSQAEEAAEESLLEYLTENYEIEQALSVGKNLLPYNRQITYPVGAHFYIEGKIYRAIRNINGCKRPSVKPYWEQFDDYDPVAETAPQYTQRASYIPGEFVKFGLLTYRCLEYNGLDYKDVRVPGEEYWVSVDTTEWQANVEYQEWTVVSFQGKFYALLSAKDIDLTVNPEESDNWGLIGFYDEQLNDYENSATEYVVHAGQVFRPIADPNSDVPQVGVNIVEHDPRHPNVKKHLLRLAVYELHKLISPHNISSARITDYETSITWLRDAGRLKINPQIPRKLDDTSRPVTDYAIATFARDYNPHENLWQI